MAGNVHTNAVGRPGYMCQQGGSGTPAAHLVYIASNELRGVKSLGYEVTLLSELLRYISLWYSGLQRSDLDSTKQANYPKLSLAVIRTQCILMPCGRCTMAKLSLPLRGTKGVT